MTGTTYDIDKFRELLKKAIGGRKQKEFAEIAGLSYFNLNRMLKNDSNGVPKRSSLEKIAEASQGRVTVSQLLYACGYEPDEPDPSSLPAGDPDETMTDGKKKCAAIAGQLINALEKLSGSAQKYGSVEAFLETAAYMAGKGNIRFSLQKPEEYAGTGRRGAENYVSGAYYWVAGGYDAVLAFSLFFSRTEKGGYIISDCAFDLDTLLKCGNERAGRYLMAISAEGDVKYTDHPVVYHARRHVISTKEEKLLAAIFREE